MSTIPTRKIREFARITVETGDLDPMYVLIDNMYNENGRWWTSNFVLHFFLFYDAGEAAVAAKECDKGVGFWKYVTDNYCGFRRGTERRHFRGDKGLVAIDKLSKLGDPIDVLNALYRSDYSSLVKNLDNFKGCQIGNYFAWKLMDLFDRGLGRPVSLSLNEAVKYMPDEPLQCAVDVWGGQHVRNTVIEVLDMIKDLRAPGTPDRFCSYSEVETVLCMIKGYFKTRSHTIGDDIDEKHEQLKDHPDLLLMLPPMLTSEQRAKYARAVGTS